MPATGATGKPISLSTHVFNRWEPAPVDPEDCPHTVRSFRKGQWTCKRCGAPR